jgi:hypothetical protein
MKRLFAVLTTALLISSCNPLVKITLDQPKDEVFTKPILNQYFKNDQKTILLRIPNQSGVVTNSNTNENQLYNYIEKDFFKSGFIVRDRAIFEKVLTQSQDIDYSKVKELTNTDIILEIVSIQKQEYETNKYEKNDKAKVARDCHWKFPGSKIDLKIIMVKENEIAGIYTFYQTQCINGCIFNLHKCQLRDINAGMSNNLGYSTRTEDLDTQQFADYITGKIMGAMK